MGDCLARSEDENHAQPKLPYGLDHRYTFLELAAMSYAIRQPKVANRPENNQSKSQAVRQVLDRSNSANNSQSPSRNQFPSTSPSHIWYADLAFALLKTCHCPQTISAVD